MFNFSDCENLAHQEAIAHRVDLSGGHLSEAVATRLAILTTHRIPAIDCLNRTTSIAQGMSLTAAGVPLVRIRRVVTVAASLPSTPFRSMMDRAGYVELPGILLGEFA